MSPRFSPDRRGLLKVLGLAGGAIGSLTLARAQDEPPSGNVTTAPISGATQDRHDFYGLHQAGIVTPRPVAGMMVSFDILARTPGDVVRLFRGLTDRMAFLTQGGLVPEIDPRLPPPDSGLLGPEVIPNNLTATVSVGASLFDDRFGLSAHKPLRLQRMAKFRNDALEAGLCHGDLSIQFCSNSADTNIHALRDVMKNFPDLLLIRWKQEGTVPSLDPKPGAPPESARNFLGFRDGSANPVAADNALMDELVWVMPGAREPRWTAGGSYQAVRIIRNFVERWDRTPLGEQERIIGRRKMSGSPLDGKVESDAPGFERDSNGKMTPLDAHIRLANPRTAMAAKNRILRRPFNYSNGVTKSGQLDMGLLFIAYQSDLEAGFITVQKRLDGEPLEEYIKPVGGGFFFALPGAVGPSDFLGRGLFEAAGLPLTDVNANAGSKKT